jgi:hypothetical protein
MFVDFYFNGVRLDHSIGDVSQAVSEELETRTEGTQYDSLLFFSYFPDEDCVIFVFAL